MTHIKPIRFNDLTPASLLIAIALLFIAPSDFTAQRKMERLNRGVIAVNEGSGNVFVSWRLLGNDPEDIAFNLYRQVENESPHLMNPTPIKKSTNYLDSGVSFNQPVKYSVRPVINGEEQESGTPFVLPAEAPVRSYIPIPLKEGDYFVQHAWPGDLTGDGQYELVVSRLPRSSSSGTPVIEAYKLDGTFLWRVDMGINAVIRGDGNAANDGPPASISGFGNVAGYRDTDNITVYDLSGDGKAEVFVRTGPGVRFADGREITGDPMEQYISVIDGLKGNEITRIPVPNDYVEDGPLSGHFGIGYLDGIHPSLITKFENRVGSVRGPFNLLVAAYDFDGEDLTKRWKWLREDQIANNFHQIRILDVNGNGKDNICDGSYVLNHDGTHLYSVPDAIHGDRFHITVMDPDIPGLQGYGIQQREGGTDPKFPWYYYHAATGEIIRDGGNIAVDVARGTVADVDPRHPGLEMWSYGGLYNVKGEKISDRNPTTNLKIWWDGDLLGEILDKTVIEKWDYENERSVTIFAPEGVRHNSRNVPPFYGDILGDWREEVVWEAADHSELRIYSTTTITPHRMVTLPHNPAYRLCFTTKGYMQSTLVDFYLGVGMEQPPRPNIQIVGEN